MMIRTAAASALLTLALAGCATPETRLRNGLVSAGLPRPVAGCMAEKMVDRLSITQLRRLESLSSLKDERIGDLTIAQFWRKVRALRDPEVLAVTTRAGLSCSIDTL